MAEPRSRLRSVLIGLALALFATGLLLFWTAPDPERVGPAGEAVALRAVKTQRVRAVPIRSRAAVAGVLEARRSVQLFAETHGAVIQVGAEALDRVEAGQLLLAVDPFQAEVAVEHAVATLARADSELALARSNLERRRSLAQRSVASDADLEDAENAEKVAAAALRQSRADLERARDDLEKKTIVAPFAGVLRSFQVEQGEYVREGQELGELLDLETARVVIGLSDRQIVMVGSGQPVEVAVEAYPGESFAGRILRVGAASDPSSRKFPVEVELPNPEGRLLPGMVASVAFDLGAEQPRTLIPREASVEEFGLRFVWVIEREGEALVARRRRVDVRALPFHPAEFELLSGVAEGEEIALTATRQLREGERVKRDGTPTR
jgi:membrane fusion protein (multidrug efflux system)